ncbi:hypothetical protein M1D30_03170 [Prevotella sp. E15-22]|uniref:hypothetical protein n=1 Tax=Prevotella sp. E15-22 TaxID=2937774 RepID=UPI002050A3BD|nr:hypothetical protein [Prevotella sp. E15-22]UPS45185.1 hypothetical protein M1D30_03170 [Prevotella sp. E15-22]
MISLFKKIFGHTNTSKPLERIPLPQTKEEKEIFLKRYLDTLTKHGWVLEPSVSVNSAEKEKKQAVDCLTRLDSDLLSFLYSFKSLDNDSEDVWFVGLDTQTDNLCFGENLVIMESYVIEDSTISVVLQGENKGKFVYCNEGIYEDAEIIADDFFSFLQLHAYCVELGKDTVKNNPLWAFV